MTEQKIKQQIDLVATDLDMTLLRSDHHVSPANKAAAHRIVESGRHLVLVTGRMYKGAVHVAEELELDVPIISYNGAMIKKGLSGELLYRAEMDKAVAAAALRRGQELDLVMQVYVNEDYYTARPNPASDYYQEANGVPIQYCSDLAAKLNDGVVLKVLSIGQPELCEQLAREIMTQFPEQVAATRSMREYMDFAAPGVSKGAALSRLLPLVGVTAENTLGIGDNLNDRALLQTVGVPVAMGNAVPELKELAAYVTGSNDEDGWAAAMNKLVFGDE